MLVSAVVLNWNGEKYFKACLQSLEKIDISPDKFEVIVVDNHSSDDSVSVIRRDFPKYNLIVNDSNLGYAQGNNVGIQVALSHNANFVWVLNPDVMVTTASLKALIKAANDYPGTGIFGCKIYFAPGYEFHKDRYSKSEIGHVFWYAGGQMDWANLVGTHRGVDEVDHGQYDLDTETDFVTGASLFVRRRVLDAVGLFDAKYFLYYEENDFCQRVKKHGWNLMYISSGVVWHANAQATGIGSSLQDYYITRNRMLFGMRYAPLHTKLALLKQSLQIYMHGRPWQKRAILDYYTGNLGAGSYQP